MIPATPPHRGSRALPLGVAFFLLEFVVWHLLRYRTTTALVVSLIAVLPWLPLWRGLSKGRRRTHLYATLLLAPYLTYGLMELVANPGARLPAALFVCTGMILFVGITHGLRVRRPETPTPI
jgi:uncharacterized membrane protein